VATLFDLCSLMRSKNAGPFVLTFDIMFPDRETYERVKRAKPITTELMARLYRQREADVTLVYHDHALAIKVSMPRPIYQGELADADGYGGQQYAPLMSIEVR
jgi:hypothetical protein